METAYDLMQRLVQLEDYILSLKKARQKMSNFDAEFGEGNTHAIIVEELIDELKKEYESIEKELINTKIGE